jgi:hypothetical protein
METHPRHNQTSTATSGPVDENPSRSIVRDSQAIGIFTSKPTVAGAVPKGMESQFQAASLKDCEFFRPCAPKSRCKITNLSRSALIELAEEAGAIVRARLRGRARGSCLIHKDTLLAHLRNLAATQAEARMSGKEGASYE